MTDSELPGQKEADARADEAQFQKSVTVWIRQLKEGHEDAAERLWSRFFSKLVQLADRKMGNAERRTADQEDVAVSVFESLCLGAREGRFDRLQNRDDLWKLLIAISGMKVVDQIRRQTSLKRGAGNVRGDSIVQTTGKDGVPATFEQFMSQEPTPELIASLDEEQSKLMDQLPDETLRQIAQLRLEGFDNSEIAERLEISLRSVERKVALVRDIWVTEIESE